MYFSYGINLPGFPHETPPNLRTTLPERPLSAGRSRPGAALTVKGHLENTNSGSMTRRQPSPIVTRGRIADSPGRGRPHGNGHVVEMVESRRTLHVPESITRKPIKMLNSESGTGFGRSISKKSLDMAIKHMGGATHVDIACDPELVKLVTSLTRLPVCVSSVDPSAFLAAVEAGASMVEIGNYDSFYDAGIVFSPEQILNLTMETRRILPLVTLSVTVPHTLSLPDQAKLAELLEQEGVDIIQTEGGKCSNPSKSGVLGLIEKASPTLAAAYSISRAVKIPVMCASGLSAVTAPMAITAGAAGVGVGSAINKLNDVVAMIAEVRSIADSLGLSMNTASELENRSLRL